jgi:signal transduction histidine kinase
LLDLSQIESGRIQLNIVEVLPAIPVQKALDAVFVSAQQKNVMIESKLDDSIPLVRADAEKVTWVLINFLTNAIKHSTEKSKILIQVRLVSDNVSFEVIDQGKGISPIYVERIFERFFQIPGTEKSGNGLGLSICKEFIEAMGGKIGVKSEEGKGSCFFFYLPRIKTD